MLVKTSGPNPFVTERKGLQAAFVMDGLVKGGLGLERGGKGPYEETGFAVC